ncbi:MAG TPA: CoA-transferase [Bryobacterales bacterium]|nr:CoA-transferase [Bryobacterales bacterium]
MRKPVVTADEAVSHIQDEWTIAIGGSGSGHSIAEQLLAALGRRFRRSGSPRGLTLVHPFGVGNQKDRGLEHLADPRLVRRIIGGHWSMSPSMARLAAENKIEAYNLPAGIIVQLLGAAAAASPAWISEIGLGTFIDPRLEGGKLNAAAKEDLVELFARNGREYLLYKAFPVHAALIRGTAADPLGNLNMDEEVAPWDNCIMAQAARASGGITLAQVKRTADLYELDPRTVRVPGIFVDYIAVDPQQGQTFQVHYDPSLCGAARKPPEEFGPFPLTIRKVIARRAALELFPGAVINLGFGMPDGVMKVAREQGIESEVTPTVEHGQIGGIPAEGLDFGASYNSTAIIETRHQFDFYHGRGVDLAFLGFAEVDAEGNVNVSRIESAVIGTGGFIDIAQKARRLVFCGTLAARSQVDLSNGRLRLLAPGTPKFVPRVKQITFSGPRALADGHEVLYVTEAGVFRLGKPGVELIEAAPGLSVERDILPQMAFRPAVASPLKQMLPELFQPDVLPRPLFRHFR